MNGSIYFIVGFIDCWKVIEVEMFWSEMFEMCIGLVYVFID